MLYREVESKIKEHSSQLEQKLNKTDKLNKSSYDLTVGSNLWDLNDFNERTRTILQGLTQGQVNAVLGKGNVKLDNLAISITATDNIFDKNDSGNEVGKAIASENGTTWTNATTTATYFIPVLSNTTYTRSTKSHMAFYDSNKVYISGINNSLQQGTFTTPSNCAYVRITINNTDISSFMLVSGFVLPTTYQPFTLKIDGNYIKNTKEVDNSVFKTQKLDIVVGTNKFNKNASGNETGKSLDSATGNTWNSSTVLTSEYIEIKPSTNYTRFSTAHACWYDENKVFISGVNASENKLTITSPSNAKYLRQTMLLTQLNDYMIVEGDVLPTNYKAFEYVLLVGGNAVQRENKSVWNGLKWTSFGDSITALDSWQKLVANELGLIHTVRGIGGTTVAETNSIAWVDSNGLYLDRPPATQPTGSTEIKSSFCNQQRIDTIPLDTQVITVMGGTNDKGQNVPLGVYEDIYSGKTDTFYGAYGVVINKIRTRIPNARIFIMTPPQIAIADNSLHKYNEYITAIRNISSELNCPLIDIYRNSGINKQQIALFSPDLVHPTTEVAKKTIANTVINEFNNIKPF